ncbi:MAG: hypothetical protein EBT59_09250 [Betaproteobacteria bacterium]|nr:hypothetical protein [Betaproteobacteria bacterium]
MISGFNLIKSARLVNDGNAIRSSFDLQVVIKRNELELEAVLKRVQPRITAIRGRKAARMHPVILLSDYLVVWSLAVLSKVSYEYFNFAAHTPLHTTASSNL